MPCRMRQGRGESAAREAVGVGGEDEAGRDRMVRVDRRHYQKLHQSLPKWLRRHDLVCSANAFAEAKRLYPD